MTNKRQPGGTMYTAKRNLEAETPTKNFCSQIRKPKERVKLKHSIKERKLTQAEQLADRQPVCQKKPPTPMVRKS